MSTDATALVAKYTETFVKEALARATLERTESSAAGDKFLEVRSFVLLYIYIGNDNYLYP